MSIRPLILAALAAPALLSAQQARKITFANAITPEAIARAGFEATSVIPLTDGMCAAVAHK